jgi:CheY-like chemotaxis protein
VQGLLGDVRKSVVGLPPLVLVVDDDGEHRAMYAEYLPEAGFRALTAADGPEAIATALSAGPDVIILDLAMPGMDGCEVARALRADPRTRDTCILALTGHPASGHYVKARAAGCNLFLSKPCSPRELVAHLDAWFAHQQPK